MTAARARTVRCPSPGHLLATIDRIDAGWTRPDMLLRYTQARAGERAAEEARRLNLGDV